MKCNVHPAADSVGKCTACGKEVCEECKRDFYGTVLCKACGDSFASSCLNLIGGSSKTESYVTIIEGKSPKDLPPGM